MVHVSPVDLCTDPRDGPASAVKSLCKDALTSVVTEQTLASKPEVSFLHRSLRGTQPASWYTRSFTAEFGSPRAISSAYICTRSRVIQSDGEAVTMASHPYVSLDRTKTETFQAFGGEPTLPREELYQTHSTKCFGSHVLDVLGPRQSLVEDHTKELCVLARCDRHSSEFDGHFLPYWWTVGDGCGPNILANLYYMYTFSALG